MPVEELDPKPPNPLDRGGETPYNKGVHKGGTPITYQQTLTQQHKLNFISHLNSTTPTTREELLSFTNTLNSFLLTHPTLTTQERKELTILRETTNHNFLTK